MLCCGRRGRTPLEHGHDVTATPEGRSFGEVLRRYRVAAGLSQEALADRAGLSLRGVSDLERGLSRAPGCTRSAAWRTRSAWKARLARRWRPPAVRHPSTHQRLSTSRPTRRADARSRCRVT